MVVTNSISVYINSNCIEQYKHTPVIDILLVSKIEEMVVDTISVLIPIFIRSDNSITHYINILIMTVTRGKLLASSVVSISFIVEGTGEFTSLLIYTLNGPLSLCSYRHS